MSELTVEARARLATLADHTELGAGFAIAMRDLEIRGAGDLLGAEQSGHVAAVGFELYVELRLRDRGAPNGRDRVARHLRGGAAAGSCEKHDAEREWEKELGRLHEKSASCSDFPHAA